MGHRIHFPSCTFFQKHFSINGKVNLDLQTFMEFKKNKIKCVHHYCIFVVTLITYLMSERIKMDNWINKGSVRLACMCAYMHSCVKVQLF